MARYGWMKRWQTWNKDKVMRLLLWIGLAGIALIAVSEWLPSHKEETKETAVSLTASQVERAMETRISALLRQVEGVGACRVMVTLESDVQTVYATDTVSSVGVDGSSSLSENYLTVDTEAGPVGLLLTHLQPTVKGVAVVCDGGDRAVTRQRVIEVVSTAFHISERRVCVVKQE